MRRIAPFQLGTDNEQLVQFKVKPRRKRIGGKKAPEVRNPAPAPSGGSPEASAAVPV